MPPPSSAKKQKKRSTYDLDDDDFFGKDQPLKKRSMSNLTSSPLKNSQGTKLTPAAKSKKTKSTKSSPKPEEQYAIFHSIDWHVVNLKRGKDSLLHCAPRFDRKATIPRTSLTIAVPLEERGPLYHLLNLDMVVQKLLQVFEDQIELTPRPFEVKLFLKDYHEGKQQYSSKALLQAACSFTCLLPSVQGKLNQDGLQGSAEELGMDLYREALKSIENLQQVHLTTIQALVILSMRQSLCNETAAAYELAAEAIRFAAELELHKPNCMKKNLASLDDNYERVCHRTFWTAYQQHV